jgi:hypothetical protein
MAHFLPFWVLYSKPVRFYICTMKRTIFIAMCITVISCGTPKKRYDRLIRKYPHLVETDTVIVKDTIIKEVKVPVPEYKRFIYN